MSACDRCGAESFATTGSYFNREMICLACARREQAHPEYGLARETEAAAVKRGDYNFPGVGLPKDLR